MLIVIANDLPPAVRGRMKLWFIEPKPNVFISGISDAVAEEVVAYLQSHCGIESGILIVRSISKAPGLKWALLGEGKRKLVNLSGLLLPVNKDEPAK